MVERLVTSTPERARMMRISRRVTRMEHKAQGMRVFVFIFFTRGRNEKESMLAKITGSITVPSAFITKPVTITARNKRIKYLNIENNPNELIMRINYFEYNILI